MSSAASYYPCPVRWQQRPGVLLWVENPDPDREAFWVNREGRSPIFAGMVELQGFAARQGWVLQDTDPAPADMDAVAAWVAGTGYLSPAACLSAWSLFDDLSAGSGQPFSGNRRGGVRNEVFDLLYTTSEVFPADSVVVQPGQRLVWTPRHLAKLREVLTQGLALWEGYTFWA